MNSLRLTLVLTALLITNICSAVEYVISDDGHQIQLNDDGSWIQVSKDRHTTTTDGRRIRLKPNGRWVVMPKTSGEAKPVLNTDHLTTDLTSQTKPQPLIPNVSDISIFLPKVEILKKKTKMLKSSRIDTRTVFHLQIVNGSKQTLQLDETIKSGLTATSSGKDKFPITTIQFSTASIAPGQHAAMTVFTEGSPKWFGIKYLNIQIDKNVIANNSAKILSMNIDDVIKRNVNSF